MLHLLAKGGEKAGILGVFRQSCQESYIASKTPAMKLTALWQSLFQQQLLMLFVLADGRNS
jgi:hypothetical protein